MKRLRFVAYDVGLDLLRALLRCQDRTVHLQVVYADLMHDIKLLCDKAGGTIAAVPFTLLGHLKRAPHSDEERSGAGERFRTLEQPLGALYRLAAIT